MALRATEKTWDIMYKRLEAYRLEHGDCLVPAKYEKDSKLSHWVQTQRSARKRNSLTEERVAALDAIDFVWSVNQAVWDHMFQSLVEYQMEHGDCLVPQSYPHLGQWVDRQRTDKADNRLDPSRKKQLDSLGFVWRVSVDTWEAMFHRLLDYKEKHGNCLVPQRYDKDPKLGNWVDKQRYLKSNDRIQAHREEKLNSIGFNWSVTQESWDTMFQQLKEYKEEKGDCLVPLDYDDNPKLGRWVKEQRKKRSRILDHRKEKLDSIGFVWSVPESKWEIMYQMLLEYRRLHGHCLVPKRYSPNPKLGRWVHNQRLRRHVCQPERRQKLDAIGFYDPSDVATTNQPGGGAATTTMKRPLDVQNDHRQSREYHEHHQMLQEHHHASQEGRKDSISYAQQERHRLREDYNQEGRYGKLNTFHHAPREGCAYIPSLIVARRQEYARLQESFPEEEDLFLSSPHPNHLNHLHGTVLPGEVASSGVSSAALMPRFDQQAILVPDPTSHAPYSSFLPSMTRPFAGQYSILHQPPNVLSLVLTTASAASHALSMVNAPYDLMMSERRMALLRLRRQRDLAATRCLRQQNMLQRRRMALMANPMHANDLLSHSDDGTASSRMCHQAIANEEATITNGPSGPFAN